MPANKSHHFVPQFLLRQFATEPEGKHLCLFRVKERKHVKQASIRHQCARDDYYGKDPEMEKALPAPVDGRVA
jgi:hypothetical protein